MAFTKILRISNQQIFTLCLNVTLQDSVLCSNFLSRFDSSPILFPLSYAFFFLPCMRSPARLSLWYSSNTCLVPHVVCPGFSSVTCIHSVSYQALLIFKLYFRSLFDWVFCSYLRVFSVCIRIVFGCFSYVFSSSLKFMCACVSILDDCPSRRCRIARPWGSLYDKPPLLIGSQFNP